MVSVVWLIPLLPLLGVGAILTMGLARPRWSGYLAVGAIGASFVLAVHTLLVQAMQSPTVPSTGVTFLGSCSLSMVFIRLHEGRACEGVRMTLARTFAASGT